VYTAISVAFSETMWHIRFWLVGVKFYPKPKHVHALNPFLFSGHILQRSCASAQAKHFLARSVDRFGQVTKLPEPKFEWFKDKAGKFRFRLVAANGETIAVSEAYSSKKACVNGIESVKKNAPIAKTVEDRTEQVRYLMSSMKPMELTLETLRPVDLDGEIIAQKNQNGSITLYEVVK
jgi:hypothetical protein